MENLQTCGVVLGAQPDDKLKVPSHDYLVDAASQHSNIAEAIFVKSAVQGGVIVGPKEMGHSDTSNPWRRFHVSPTLEDEFPQPYHDSFVKKTSL